MRSAVKVSSGDIEISMKLVAPPLYVLTTQTLEQNKGIELLNEACRACAGVIQNAGGKMVVKAEARVVSAQDDRLLTEQLEQLEKANAEVDGDADSEAEEDTGMGTIDIPGA